MIQKIYAVWVYVNDLEQSRSFYQNALGLKEKFQDEVWLEFDLGETSFALHERPEEKGPLKPQKTRIMFQVDGIENVAGQIEKYGGKLIGNIRKEGYGKLLTFEDPNGHWLELLEPHKPQT